MNSSSLPILLRPANPFLRAAVALLMAVALAACGPGEGREDGQVGEVGDTLASEGAVEGAEPGESGERGETEDRAPPAADPVIGDDTADSGDDVRDPGAGDGAAGPGEVRRSELNPPGWTIGRIEVDASGRGGQPVVATVREARHDGFDRLVIELEGGVPAYDVEYVDRPLHECGSGRQVHPVGDGWLQIRLGGARGHTEAGESRLEVERDTPGLTRGLRLYRTCDFEGEVVLVLAVDSPERFRAFDLDGPPRVVVDVRH